MPRTPRKPSATNLYHVIARGASRQIIFEDPHDRERFLALLATSIEEDDIQIIAYCLMENHVHLLAKASLGQLSAACRRILSAYATWFNLRHGRCGHLFQDRFRSEPIEDDSYFLTTVRYIHNNPRAAGLCDAKDWKWSSYHEYVGSARIASTSLALGMLGGKNRFEDFHLLPDAHECKMEVEPYRRAMDDERAKQIAERVLGKECLSELKSKKQLERNAAIRKLKESGLGVRQIQRLTGISLGAISKA